MVRVDPGTVLSAGQLLIRGEVISVVADRPVLSGNVDVRVGRGTLTVSNASVAAAATPTARLQSQRGNVHYSGVGVVNYTLGVRQPDDRFALRAHGGSASFTAVDAQPGSAWRPM